jgi:hypothetical protein
VKDCGSDEDDERHGLSVPGWQSSRHMGIVVSHHVNNVSDAEGAVLNKGVHDVIKERGIRGHSFTVLYIWSLRT